jgi:hypothetical protein
MLAVSKIDRTNDRFESIFGCSASLSVHIANGDRYYIHWVGLVESTKKAVDYIMSHHTTLRIE